MTGRPEQPVRRAKVAWSVDLAIDPAADVRADLTLRAARSCVPLSVEVELTARCNLQCAHCYLGERRSSSGEEIGLDRLLHLVAEVHDAGCMFLTVTGGEVVLRDGWLRVVEAARRRRMVVTVLTNGTLIGPQEAEALARLRVKEVAVSIYGDTAEAHDALTGVPGSLERSVAGIKALRRAGVPVRVASVVTTANVDRLSRIRRLAERLGCTYRFDHTVRPAADGSLAPLRFRVSAAELARHLYGDEAILSRSAEGKCEAIRARTLPAVARNMCTAGFASCFVDARGDVYACAGFPPSFGNVTDASFVSVWRGLRAESHRRRMLEPLVECQSCDLRRFCLSRCPRLALVEDGSLAGPSSRACEMARLVKSLCDNDCWPEGAVSLVNVQSPARED